jgi:hypothetical protein
MVQRANRTAAAPPLLPTAGIGDVHVGLFVASAIV